MKAILERTAARPGAGPGGRLGTGAHYCSAAFALALLLLLLSAAALEAGQPSLSAEYRIDGGVPVPMVLSSTNSRPEYRESEFSASCSAADLSVGPHFLEVRMRGTNGAFCEWQGQWFRVAGETHLVGAEWFVDADPGPGLATPIPLPEDGAWDEAEEELVVARCGVSTNLAEGRHRVVMRARDSNGDWGITSDTTFYVAAEVRITDAVWVADATSWGAPGTSVPGTNTMRITTNAPNGDVEAQATVNSLAVTSNYCWAGPLYVRFQDSLGRWSTRRGLWWDETGQTWRFDAIRGWVDPTPLVVQPEVAVSPVPGQHHLFVNSNATVTLDWKDCKGVSGYAVWFRASRTVPFALLATGLTNSSLALTNLVSNEACQWLVQSLGDPGCALDGPLWQFGVQTPLPTAADSDRDGIPDDWERGYFGVLAAVNGTTDRDADGSMDWEEWQADTVPTNKVDHFTILACRTGPMNPLLGLPAAVVDWNSSLQRNYTVYQTVELEDPCSVWSILERLPGNGGLMSFTNNWPEPFGYMLIGVSPP